MIKFWEKDNKIIFSYTPDFNSNHDWVAEELDREGEVTIKMTFHFSSKDLYKPDTHEVELQSEDDFDDMEPRTVNFVFARLKGDYYKIKKGILTSEFDIYFHKEMEITPKLFLADKKISIFTIIAELVSSDVYVGGDRSGSIPQAAYQQLLDRFPTSWEQKKYVQARVASVLKDYLENVADAESKYHKYMNKKAVKKGTDLQKLFREAELDKFTTILDKLRLMLKEENNYSEKQWQEEIIQILLLIYPKYIALFKNVPVKDDAYRNKYLDYLLVDSNGHVDIIEIKQPFEKSIMTEGKYRNNFIPLRELSGTIMQLEKYIYYLNSRGQDGEAKLSDKYKQDLPEGLKIKITNPGGIVIIGRDNNLTDDQKLDFEVVKRKYKNVVDIITYDNLIRRVELTIEQIKKR